MTNDAIEILERMSKSEINAAIEWLFDEPYLFHLGDLQNGLQEQFYAKDLRKGIYKLADLATKHYPQSTFAKWWKEREQKANQEEYIKFLEKRYGE